MYIDANDIISPELGLLFFFFFQHCACILYVNLSSSEDLVSYCLLADVYNKDEQVQRTAWSFIRPWEMQYSCFQVL